MTTVATVTVRFEGRLAGLFYLFIFLLAVYSAFVGRGLVIAGDPSYLTCFQDRLLIADRIVLESTLLSISAAISRMVQPRTDRMRICRTSSAVSFAVGTSSPL
jgi:hypothetical protein